MEGLRISVGPYSPSLPPAVRGGVGRVLQSYTMPVRVAMTAKKKKVYVRPDHLITTIPVIRLCSRCACVLAAGISEGMHVTVDLTPLDAEQALMAILVGVELYGLSRTGLIHLDPWRMGDPRFAVRYPAHRCGSTWPNRSVQSGPRPNVDRNAPPPY